MTFCSGPTPCSTGIPSFPIGNGNPSTSEPDKEPKVAKLTLPDPTFSSHKLPATMYPDQPSSSGIIKELDPKLSLEGGYLYLSDDLPSAIEEYLPTNNLKLELGLDFKLIGPGRENLIRSRWLKWSLKYDFEWLKNFHPDADDTGRLTTLDLDTTVELRIWDYVQVFYAGSAQQKLQQFKSPTLFYPNARNFDLQGKVGVQFNIPQWKTALAVTLYDLEYTWFNYYRFKNVISDFFTLDNARQRTDSLGVQFTKRFEHPAAPDITAYYKHNIYYGRRHVPEALAIGNKTIVNSLGAIDVTRISAGLAFDWEPLSFYGNYRQRKFDGWPAEHIGSFNAELRTGYGDYGAGWMGLFGIDPTSPVTTHDIQLTARPPVLNKSVGVNVSFFDNHFGISLGFDVIRFAEYFEKKGSRSQAEAPASAPASQPAPAPEPESIEFDPSNPTLYRLLKCGETEAVKEGKRAPFDCTFTCRNESDKSSIDVCVSSWSNIILGNEKYKSKKYEEAILYYSKAIAANKNSALAYNNRGAVKMKLHKYEEAIKDFDKAIQIDPNWGGCYDNRARAYDKLNKKEEAQADRKKACELNFDSSYCE